MKIHGLWLALCLAACGSTAAPARVPESGALAEVAAIHGGAGPWAVLGWRMGSFALAALGLSKHDFAIEVVHAAPAEVQYSCIADGAAAATGASLGKLNLRLVEARADGVRTVFRDKTSGRSITLEPTPEFRRRFGDVPRERLGEAGREVLSLPDAQLFRVVPP
jgi:formylmethanofuran dehydrogenase subunit E